MTHTEPHPQRGEVIVVMINGTEVVDFEIEDWADRVSERYADLPDGVYGHIINTDSPPLAKIFDHADLQVRHA